MNYAQAVKRQVGKETKQVAGNLDWSREKIYKLMDGSYPNHPVEQVGNLAASTPSHAVAQYIAIRSGGYFIPAFDTRCMEGSAIIPQLAVECSELLCAFGESMADGVITADEITRMKKELADLVGVVTGFLDQSEKDLGK